jgi:acyl-coenzyme A synthetase/AMP-(fatty) acid ligase
MRPYDFLDQLEVGGSVVHDASSQPHSFSECLADARLHATHWQRIGVRAGTLVILEGLSGFRLFQAVLAAWLLEAIPFPCDGICEESFSGSSFRFRGEMMQPLRKGNPDARFDNTAIIHRTSGSTGKYRLVRRSAPTLMAEARRYRDALSLASGERMLMVLPIYHSFGWGFFLGGLLSGCSIDLRRGFSPVQIATEMDRGRVSVLGLTPPMARLLCTRPGPPPARPPRLVVVGAGPVDKGMEEAFKARFGVGLARNYGSTETGATFSGNPGSDDGIIGHPMTGVRVLQPSPEVQGELVIELTPPVDGYLDGEPTARWKTGDLVECNQGGQVRVLGRIDNKLRINGKSLDRTRIESVLLAYPKLEEALLIVRPRPAAPQIEDLVAVVKGLVGSPAELLRYCADNLPASHCPSRIVQCNDLPKNQLGKLNLKQIIRRIDRFYR